MAETVLITGAAKRIGRYLAEWLAGEGFAIVLHYGNSEEEAKDAQKVILSNGGKCELIQADLANDRDVGRFFPELAERKIYVQHIIHNASLFENLTFESMGQEDWNRHVQINLTTPVFLNQAFVKQLREKDTGRIIHLLDWRALRPGKDHFPYTISKAALVSVTQSLAASLAPRVLVNGIALGAILPPSDGGDTQTILKQVPAQRWATLEEVGDTVLFLLKGPGYITGEVIHLDGGRHLV
jgi:NAD(P)-dependent dehydrogenase (short-subunit alcohol dehydrogenase family)